MGSTRKVRWSPGETEMNLPDGWDFEDPLAGDKRTGTGTKASFNFLQATKKYANDVKGAGFMGDVTDEQAKLVRDAMDAAHRQVAKANKISADADNSQVYGVVKEQFAIARDQYWDRLKVLKDKDAWEQYRADLEAKGVIKPDEDDEDLQKEYRADVEAMFHDAIDKLTGGRHAKFLPSKARKRQQGFGQ